MTARILGYAIAVIVSLIAAAVGWLIVLPARMVIQLPDEITATRGLWSQLVVALQHPELMSPDNANVVQIVFSDLMGVVVAISFGWTTFQRLRPLKREDRP